MCVWFGGFLPLFFIDFCLFFDLVFSGPISFKINTLWAQRFLELSADHFETVHACSTRSENVHVVLLLSYFYFLLTFFNLLNLLSFQV